MNGISLQSWLSPVDAVEDVGTVFLSEPHNGVRELRLFIGRQQGPNARGEYRYSVVLDSPTEGRRFSLTRQPDGKYCTVPGASFRSTMSLSDIDILNWSDNLSAGIIVAGVSGRWISCREDGRTQFVNLETGVITYSLPRDEDNMVCFRRWDLVCKRGEDDVSIVSFHTPQLLVPREA